LTNTKVYRIRDSLDGDYMIQYGIKASELIIQLQEMIEKYGDCRVFSGGTDYPEGVQYVYYKEKGNSYIRDRSFVI